MQNLVRVSPASLADTEFDLAIVGAGINGAAIARDAATRGLSVLVVDKADVGSGTSSWSSRLIHGGLRYLEHGELRLVHESLHDRERLLHIAPHLVTPLPFVVPVYRHNHKPGWMFRAGMVLYDGLSLRKSVPRHRALGRKALAVELGSLNPDGLSAGLRYYDGQVVFAERLVLETLLSAAAAGASVLTYATASITVADGAAVGLAVHDRLTGADHAVRAKVVVNAAGPWVDEVRRLESPSAGTSVRLSKGVHLLLRGGDGWSAAVTTPLSEGRVSFAVPWQGLLLLGTTDDDFAGDPSSVTATDQDAARILDEAAVALDRDAVDPSLVASRMAGLRVLPLSTGATSRIRRGTVVSRGPAGMISVAGGKLTMWRAIGRDAARLALGRLGAGRRVDLPVRPLPGAAPPALIERSLARRHPAVPDDVVANLARNYGASALDLLDRAGGRNMGRIHAEGPDIWAQVPYAVSNEWAATVDDVLLRRTTVGLRGHADQEIRERVAAEITVPRLSP